MSPKQFPLRQGDSVIQIAPATLLQQRVAAHGTQRGRHRQGDAHGQPIAAPGFHDLQQGQIRFGDGLKEPVLLQAPLQLRVTDKRQMGVQQDGQVT